MTAKWCEPVTHMQGMRGERERCKDEIKENGGGKSAGVARLARAGWMAGVRNNMLQGKSERRYKYTEGMKPCRRQGDER